MQVTHSWLLMMMLTGIVGTQLFSPTCYAYMSRSAAPISTRILDSIGRHYLRVHCEMNLTFRDVEFSYFHMRRVELVRDGFQKLIIAYLQAIAVTPLGTSGAQYLPNKKNPYNVKNRGVTAYTWRYTNTSNVFWSSTPHLCRNSSSDKTCDLLKFKFQCLTQGCRSIFSTWLG